MSWVKAFLGIGSDHLIHDEPPPEGLAYCRDCVNGGAPCPDCGGNGVAVCDGELCCVSFEYICELCDGDGTYECETCDGEGEIDCTTCQASGLVMA